jgi:drug/metabolite transporter (DMT)-like permease
MSLKYSFLAIILHSFWGLTPLLSSLVLKEISVELYSVLRWSLSGIIFLVITILLKKWRPISPKLFFQICFYGLISYGLASFFFLYGLKLGGVLHFVVIVALYPFVLAWLSKIILREEVSFQTWINLLIAVCGIITLGLSRYSQIQVDLSVLSIFFIVCGMLCEGLMFVKSKKLQAEVSTFQMLAIAQVSTALFMWMLEIIFFHQRDQVSQLSWNGLFSILFVSLGICAGAYAVLYWLISKVDAHRLAIYEVFQTVSTVVFAILWLGVDVTWILIAGFFLVFLGLARNMKIEKLA